ncbi:MBL fold metallo-hydrolase [Desulfomicrobium escambiense]|uniref:MBL fold metallo-hydrolase n=1 Tax=Desulfomicrobium escambiense TaxID=29503 RepID=UPI00041AF9BE|nr:MBL fold metallo-hydrolase [Desulfomicrobium escambiense]
MNTAPVIHEVDAGDFRVRGVLLQGSRRSLVWDALTHPDDMAPFARACADAPPIVVYSHADWDHIQGTSAFASPLIIAQRAAVKRFQTEAPAALSELRGADPGKWDAVRLLPPDITFERSLDLDLGGVTVSLRALPGHTPDAIVALVPELDLLLAGDTVELPCPCVPRGCDLDGWIDELERWRADTRVRTVIPSHGPCGGTEVIKRTLAYLDGLRRSRPLPLSPDAAPFYVSTHRDNLRNCNLSR